MSTVGHYFVIQKRLLPNGIITGEFRNVGVVVLHPDGSLISDYDHDRADGSLVTGFINRVTHEYFKHRSIDTVIHNLGKEAGSIRGGHVLATRIEKGLLATVREIYEIFVKGSCIPTQQKRELKVLTSALKEVFHGDIESITLAVNAGEKTCVSPDGTRCHFLRTRGPYGESFCNLFEEDLLEGDQEGKFTTDPEKSWRLRLPACLESEQNAYRGDEEFIVDQEVEARIVPVKTDSTRGKP